MLDSTGLLFLEREIVGNITLMCRDQHAVCSFHGLMVGPFTLTTTPVPLRKPRARHGLKFTGPQERRASVRWRRAAFRSGSVPLDVPRRLPLHFPSRRPLTEARLSELRGFEVHGIAF